MKVIFITRESCNLPGARIRCRNFARALNKYGLEAEIFSFPDRLGAKDGKDEWRMPACKKIGYNLKAFRALCREKGAVFIMQRLHYHSFGPYLAHLFAGSRFIFDLDDWEMRENPEYYFGLIPSSKAEFLTRKLTGRSDICIAASRYLQDYLSQFNKRVYYLPSGVDTGLFKPLSGNVKLNNPGVLFSWAGTVHSRDILENLKFIIACFSLVRKKIPHIYLEFAGDGRYIKEFIEFLRATGDDHISYKGWVSPEGMPDYLSCVDIGLVPLIQESRFNKAKSPVKLFEYMAMGKPVVASCIGEAPHIIRDGENGFLAKNKDEFEAKMELLAADAGLRQKTGGNARQTITDSYSLSVLGERLYNILRALR